MEGVKDIVSGINKHLINSFTKNGINQAVAFGISELTVADKTTFPVFFKGKNGRWAGFDDKKHVIIYHRLVSVTTGSVGKGYGDLNVKEIANTYNMIMVAFFDSGKTKLMADEMFAFIQATLPEFLRGEKFTYIRTSVTSAILNSQQAFSQEYKGIAYSLKPEQNLIAISYSIESRFKKGCFNCCSEELTLQTNS